MSAINKIIDKYGVDKLNTLTKYPSIMTYHNLGEKGCLVESFVDNETFASCDNCYITEKIDGTNARIIFDENDYVIGSREELLFAKGDRFGNLQLNIVNTIKSIADQLINSTVETIRVLYGEVYGGNITQASKQYTIDKSFGFRIYDVANINLSILDEPLEKISAWREHGGQDFLNIQAFKNFALHYKIKTVPYISVIKGSDMPLDRISTYKFLQSFIDTQAGINNHGKAEGIVVRSFNRNLIRKIRFEDYERTAKREGWTL